MRAYEKMIKGLWYNPVTDEELGKIHNMAQDLSYELNTTKPSDYDAQGKIKAKLLPNVHESVVIKLPFTCDYGINCEIGENSFLNHNCYLMDCAKIKIGANVFIGPNCGLYTAVHPLDYVSRNKEIERAEEIIIEDNVWLGGGVTITPGVTIGTGSVIGAGSVVTKDIPANVVAVGNPCKPIKKIDQENNITI